MSRRIRLKLYMPEADEPRPTSRPQRKRPTKLEWLKRNQTQGSTLEDLIDVLGRYGHLSSASKRAGGPRGVA
jgi:hypothetical protein